MTYRDFVNTISNKPSYLKKGDGWLSLMFDLSEEEVKRAKREVKGLSSNSQWLNDLLIEKQQLQVDFSDLSRTIDEFIEKKKQDNRKSVDINLDKGEIKATITLKNEVTNPDDFYELLNIDPTKWKIARYWLKTHNNGSPTYSVDIRTLVSQVDYAKEFEEFLNEYDFKLPNYIQPERFNPESDNLLVLCLFDLHLGREGLPKYTLEYSSIQTERDVFQSALVNLIDRALIYKPDRILLPIGNDFYNSEYHGATSKGTPQDNTQDIHGMFKTGLDILTWAIEYLSVFAPVDVLYVPGNHDSGFGQSLALALEKVFEKSEQVRINALPTPRKYYQYGVNGLMLEHGEITKAEEYALIFATEGKSVYSQTENHEVLLGHRHHEHCKEVKGIMVRWLGALASTDRWHFSKGYVGGKKRSYCLVYNKEQGKIAEFTNIE